MIAANCDPADTRKLSREKKLFCPNCNNAVQFKKGKVIRAHFAHVNSECIVTNYEPETDSHLNGKEIIFNWLKKKYPSAKINTEVYIKETKQIADVFLIHTDKGMEGLKWAFEFQHSPLSSTDWEKRHDLYKSAGIQDFWILDQAKYMRFSKAQGITDARIRNDLETTIFNQTGLSYFLDLKKSELTIDFDFYISYENKEIKGKIRRTPYTYHRPIHHSCNLDQARIRMNAEFNYGVFVFDNVEEQMEERLRWLVAKFRREQQLQLKKEFDEQLIKKKSFAKKNFENKKSAAIETFIDRIKEYIEIREIQEDTTSNEYKEFYEDVRCMQDHNFFEKYNELIEKILKNLQDYRKFEESDDIAKKAISEIVSEIDFYELPFLIDQGSNSLEDYLTNKYQEKIDLIVYVYTNYKDTLEKLSTKNSEYVKKKLKKINYWLTVYRRNPTPIDYALQFRYLKSKNEIDSSIQEIKEKIINFNPFAGDEW